MTPAASGRRKGAGANKRAASKRGPGSRSEGPSQVDRLQDIHDKLAEGVERIQSNEGWKQLLDGASRLQRYSANNVMLLLMQRDNISSVAGFQTWKAQGRQVRKGEKALYVLAPLKQRLDVEDKDTGETQKVTKLRGFRPAAVFDISQTDGPELPKPVRLTGEGSPALRDAMIAVLQEHGYAVKYTKIQGGAKGDTSPEGVVRIDPRGSDLEQLAVLAHELSHVAHGHIEDIEQYSSHRGRFEVEAESSAYIVLSALGLDLGDWSADYSAQWAHDNPELVQETADKVVKTANQMLDGIAPIMNFGTEREEVGDVVGFEVGLPGLTPEM